MRYEMLPRDLEVRPLTPVSVRPAQLTVETQSRDEGGCEQIAHVAVFLLDVETGNLLILSPY